MTDLNNYAITTQREIAKALNMPESVFGKITLQPLLPVGMSKFKGDTLPGDWSQNPYFNIDEKYPVYKHEDRYFAIGRDGHGYGLMTPAWGVIESEQF